MDMSTTGGTLYISSELKRDLSAGLTNYRGLDRQFAFFAWRRTGVANRELDECRFSPTDYCSYPTP